MLFISRTPNFTKILTGAFLASFLGSLSSAQADVACTPQLDADNPFALPEEQSCADGTENDQRSLTGIAASTEGARIRAEQSAEDQAAIAAYQAYLDTGETNDFVEQHFADLIKRYHAGELSNNPDLRATVAKMIAYKAIVDLLNQPKE